MTSGTGSSAAGGSGADDPAALYVYGIVGAGDEGPLPEAGVGDPPGALRLVEDGPLAAVVSPLPAGVPPGRREDLSAHHRALSEIVQRTTVVPMRFGVVMDGEEVVREELLRRHGPVLEELLAAVRDKVQMSVKAFYLEDALLREVMAARPDVARKAAEVRDRPDAEARGTKIWLGEVIADEIARRREADEQRLVQEIAPVVDDVRVEPPANERAALNAQVLVGRDGRGPLDDAIRRITEAESDRLAVRYTGPLAPFSFADLSLQDEGAAWG